MMSHRDGVQVSAEEYAQSKIAFIKANSGENNPMKKPEVRAKLVAGAAKRDKSTYKGVSRPGELNPNYGKHTLAGENHFYYGKHRDKETCEKVSKTRIERGVAKGAKNPRARAVICSKEGMEDIIYDTGAEAAEAVNGAKSGICRACKQGTIYKGYYWRYK